MFSSQGAKNRLPCQLVVHALNFCLGNVAYQEMNTETIIKKGRERNPPITRQSSFPLTAAASRVTHTVAVFDPQLFPPDLWHENAPLRKRFFFHSFPTLFRGKQKIILCVEKSGRIRQHCQQGGLLPLVGWSVVETHADFSPIPSTVH